MRKPFILFATLGAATVAQPATSDRFLKLEVSPGGRQRAQFTSK